MHITPAFTPAALEQWAQISDHGKELILSSIWCGSCKTVRGVRDASGELHPSGDIILYGFCPDCGSKVYRVIEIGETHPLKRKGKAQLALTFRVSHGDFSVTIVHPSAHTLENLAESIIRWVNFDMDHCYGFYSNLKRVSPSEEEYTLFADIGEEVNQHDKGVQTTLLTDVFKPKKQMLFLFDYGDDWRFLVTCQSIEETKSMFRRPKILNPTGTPPEQYPDYD